MAEGWRQPDDIDVHSGSSPGPPPCTPRGAGVYGRSGGDDAMTATWRRIAGDAHIMPGALPLTLQPASVSGAPAGQAVVSGSASGVGAIDRWPQQ
jgi:hypothetical protein